MVDSTPRRNGGKVPRPPADFPLRVHKGTGYWCKKVQGRVYYFGRVRDDPKGVAAMEEWLRVRDDLLAGREPKPKDADALTVETLCFRFLEHKEHLRDTGELHPRSYADYFATAKTTAETLGRKRAVADLVPDDFRKLRAALAKTRGVVALRNAMQRVRSIFKFAFDEGMIPAPVRFGQGFDKPKMDVVRRAREADRAKNGLRMFEAPELRRILTECKQPLRAMVLLALNGGLGQSDLAALPTRAVDLNAGWLDYARVKTGVRRRIPLWPETIEAIREWLPRRPRAKHKDDAGLLFLTVRGQRWVKVNATGTPADALGQEFAKILNRLKIKRPGVSFYALRHTLETVGGDTADQVAVDAIMGHVPKGMGATYRERLSDDRLRRVVEHVRAWVFPPIVPSAPSGAICDPCDPSDPPPENSGETGSKRGRKPGRKTDAPAPVATPVSPEKTGGGAHGSHGSQTGEPDAGEHAV